MIMQSPEENKENEKDSKGQENKDEIEKLMAIKVDDYVGEIKPWSLAMVLVWIRTRDFDWVQATNKVALHGCWCHSLNKKITVERAKKFCSQYRLLPVVEKSRKKNKEQEGIDFIGPDEAFRQLHERLTKGTIICSARRRRGTKVVEIKSNEWMHLHVDLLGDGSFVLSGEHSLSSKYIYRDIQFEKSEVLKIWRPNPPPKQKRKISDFRDFLREEMRASPNFRTKLKNEFQNIALNHGVSAAEFQKIWKELATKLAPNWLKAGRPKKSP